MGLRLKFNLVLLVVFLLGLGVTDPLTGMVSDWAGTIVTAYVGGRTFEKVAKILHG